MICRREKGHGESSSTCQSDDEDVSGGGFLSDSESSDSDSDSAPDGPSGFPGHTGKRIMAKERSVILQSFSKTHSSRLQRTRKEPGKESDLLEVLVSVLGGTRSCQELECRQECRQHCQVFRQHFQIDQRQVRRLFGSNNFVQFGF